MKPPPFDYLRAGTVEEALEALSRGGEGARILAGGQSLLAMLNMRLIQTELLVDISAIDSLAYIRIDGEALEVGAATTQAELERWPELAQRVPLIAAAIPNIGHFQTRNRGTVCGSIAHADPSSELPLCLATLGGEVVLRSVRGERRLAASRFQLDLLSTARQPDEMVVAVRFQLCRTGEGFAFREVARRAGDFAIVAIAARVTNGSVRIGVGGVAPRPEVRDFEGLDEKGLDDALNAFAWELEAVDDLHASARYRRELVRRLGRSTIGEANECRS